MADAKGRGKVKTVEQPKAPKSEGPKGGAKGGDTKTQQLAGKAKPDPKSPTPTAVDPKAKQDPKAAKTEMDAKSKFDTKAGKVAFDAKGKVDTKAKADPKTEVDAKSKAAKGKLDPKEQKRLDKEGKNKEKEQDMDIDSQHPEETVPRVPVTCKISNVYEHFLEKHPAPKPWSFDMSPPRRLRDKPIIDPFIWSKTFVHPWGHEKTKDPETIAEEERLASLEAARLAKKYIRPCRPEEHSHKRTSIYCQPDREPIYKLDIYGNPKLNEAGNPIYEPVYMLNSLGNVLVDGEGYPVSVYLLDAEGNVKLDAEGKPTPGPTYMLDAKGNCLLDEAGNLVPEPEHVDLLDEAGNVVLDEHGHPRHQPKPVFMLDAQGHVMLDQGGNRIPGCPYVDAEGNAVMTSEGKPVLGRFQYGHLDVDDDGQLVFDAEGNILLDVEGFPLLEKQETTEEKKFRLAMEVEARKAKAFQEKLEKDRIMMLTPPPKKPVAWRKYVTNMYLPRSLKTVVYKDRGQPGDDWRYFVKKYTIQEMNHRMAVQLHGKTGVIWRKLHEHVTYTQNPRYAAGIKQVKALRVFRKRETKEGPKYDLIDPHILYFDGFEPDKKYIQHLRVYNVSPWTQRLRVVKPATPEYFITSSEETFQGKNLVSGHKCDFDVLFQPPTVILYKDVVTIKTETQTLPLVLEAINPLPIVVLPKFVDMGLCLSGHAVCYHYILTSKGAGADFYFKGYDTSKGHPDYFTVIEDPRYDDLKYEYANNNVLYVPPFMVYPRHFETTADSKQEFIVLFRPPQAGVYTFIIQLRTDTDLRWEIKFQGTAVDLKLNLQKMNGKDFLPGQAELGLSFGQVTISHTTVIPITVLSQTPVPVRFYWKVQDKHVHLDKEEDPEVIPVKRLLPIENLRVFVPQPEGGVFAAESETDINFKFTPSDLANYHQVACLYVDTRNRFPLNSDVWKDFQEALALVEYKKANLLADQMWDQRVLWGIDRSAFECSDEKLAQDDLQEIVAQIDKIFHVSGIDNSGTIFRIAELELEGSGTQFDVEICPKVYIFSGILTLGETHLGNVEIVNRSPTRVLFTWHWPKIPYGVVKNEACVFPLTGEVAADSRKKIQVTMRAKTVGRIELELYCLIESPYHKGKLPLTLKVEGHVVGPNVILSPSVLDFGLCQIDSTYSLFITLKNKSEYADAPFRIFSTRDSQVPFSSPFVAGSQMNPSAPNTKVPIGSHLFHDELFAIPPEVVPPPPTLVTILPGHAERIPEVLLPADLSADPNQEQLPSTSIAEKDPELIHPTTIEGQGPLNTISKEGADPPKTSDKQGKPSKFNSKKDKKSSTFKQEEDVKELPDSFENLEDPEVPIDPHAFCGPCYKAPIIPPAINPLDREVSPEFIPAPQQRAWISRGFGEHLQIFNDGITDPKLPPTTLFQPRDPFSHLPPLQPLPQLNQTFASGIMAGLTNLIERKIIPPVGDSRQTVLPSPVLLDETKLSLNEKMDKDSVPRSPSLRPRSSSFVDTSFSHLKGLPAASEKEVSPKMDQPVERPFLEKMKTLGCLPQTFGPSGPPKFFSDKATYEEDLRQKLIFEPAEGIAPKGDKPVTIKVTLTGTICGFMRLSIVCEISEGLSPTQYAICRANIDAPEACLLPCFIDLRTKFINIPITINVVIRNLKSLPACFSWPNRDRVGVVEDLDVEVIKQRGEIGPRLEWGLTMNLIPRKLGPLDTILICNVFKMINPLGLQLKAIIVDARISYHVYRPDREDGHQKSGRKVAHERILLRRHQNKLGNPVEEEDPDNWVDPPVPCLDFGRRKTLGRAHCLKLVLHNHSPIEVKVKLTVGKYLTEPLASLLKDEAWVISSLTERLSYLIPVRRDPFQKSFKHKERDKSSEFHLNTPALTDLSDTHLKYFSQPGKQILWRRAEGAMHKALIREGMPVAFLCYPSYTGVIKPWGDWSVEVMCFSNLPGNYIDILTSKVGRLDPVDLPMEAQVIGTPLVARRNWLEPKGLQQPEDEGEIKVSWQPAPAGHHSVTRQFWVWNNSPFHIELKWEIKQQATIEGGKFVSMNFVIEEDKLTHALITERPEWYADEPTTHVTVKEHIGIVYEQQVHCVFRDYLKNAEFYDEPSDFVHPFFIHPRQQVILGHSSYPFEVTFHENRAQSYSCILTGYQRVYDGRSTERRRSTQFVFDSTFDRKDEQYVYRRPEKKHICEHVVSFYKKIDDAFVHTLAHKTTIVDPADPEVLALQLTEEGTKPKRLSRFHCSEASNSSTSSDDEKPSIKRAKATASESKKNKQLKSKANAAESKKNKQKKSIAKVVKFLESGDDELSDFDEKEPHPGGALRPSILLPSSEDGGKGGERAYSKVHDIAYESESEEDEPKYQFDIRRRSTRTRRVSTGLEVNFEEAPAEAEADAHAAPEPEDEDWPEPDWPEPEPDLVLDLSETLATAHCKDLYTFEAIRSLRVSLDATVLIPRLKTNLDDSLLERLSFQCFGNDPPEKRFDVQTLFLTNIYAHSILFNVHMPEQFSVLNIRHGVLQPAEHGDRCRRMSILQYDSFHFSLGANHTLQFNLSYRPVVNECLLDPPDIIVDCGFRIQFTDCNYDQIIPLHAHVMFPELRLMTETLNLGDVVTATDTQATDFSLSNPSLPDADWRIVTDESHQQTVALAASGIPPKWEEPQGLIKIWPIIWSANPERGVVRGRRENELGATNEIQYYRNRSIVTISFAPFDLVDYELTFWVEVRLGRGVRMSLKGTGIDDPPDLMLLPPPTPPPSKKGKDAKKGKDVAKGKDRSKGK